MVLAGKLTAALINKDVFDVGMKMFSVAGFYYWSGTDNAIIVERCEN